MGVHYLLYMKFTMTTRCLLYLTGPEVVETYQDLVNSLQVLEVITPVLHHTLRDQVCV